MSFEDFDINYVVVNGLTNEHIKIQIPQYNRIITTDVSITEYNLLQTILDELKYADTITICKTYIKEKPLYK